MHRIFAPPYPQLIFDTFSGSTPFFAIALTFGVYLGAASIHRAIGSPIFLHPLPIAIAGIAVTLKLVGAPYERYYENAEPLHLLLGPVVVLLAVPLWRQRVVISQLGFRLALVLRIGAVTGIATSAGVALLLGASGVLVSTIAPKSVTMPVAIELSESLGGVPAITALPAISTRPALPFASLRQGISPPMSGRPA